MSTITIPPGPLSRFPPPPDADTALALQKIGGHTTSDAWLPEGESPVIDALRDDQMRLRGQLAGATAAYFDLLDAHRLEDSDHADTLRDAQRAGTPGAVVDERTPEGERAEALESLAAQVWAAVEIMGEVRDDIIDTIRQQEGELLGALRVPADEAQVKRLEAERLLAEAASVEWRTILLGRWIQTTADDGPFGAQPHPDLDAPAPPHLSADALAQARDEALARPWHKEKSW